MILGNSVTLSYSGHLAVDRVSFSVNPGDYLCIIGSNGSGKTTLMKGILGLEPLHSGSIQFHGLEQKEIGYLPQQTLIQKDFPATVYEVALSGNLNALGRKPFFSKDFKKRTLENLKLLGVSSLKDKSYRDLSGGQQQRVLLARALCATHTLLLLDEPVTGLDPQAATEMYAIIHQLNKDLGVSIIMISHDIPQSVKYSSHYFTELNTKSEFFGTTREYKQSSWYQHVVGGESHL